jgi:hypothetical protein
MFKKSLSQRSSEALGLFSKAIDSLQEVNEDILRKKNLLATDLLSIEIQINDLTSISNNNTKVIKNIEKILS